MIKNRKTAKIYLVDIKYKHSMNHFECHYGDAISYAFIEQESYIDLKKMMLDMISEKIKFRKHERNDMVLTLKVELMDEELEKFEYLLKENKIRFLHDYEVSNIKEYIEE